MIRRDRDQKIHVWAFVVLVLETAGAPEKPLGTKQATMEIPTKSETETAESFTGSSRAARARHFDPYAHFYEFSTRFIHNVHNDLGIPGHFESIECVLFLLEHAVCFTCAA